MFEAAVEDADEPRRECPECKSVVASFGSLFVVVCPGARGTR